VVGVQVLTALPGTALRSDGGRSGTRMNFVTFAES
jgi:hypothetical protein